MEAVTAARGFDVVLEHDADGSFVASLPTPRGCHTITSCGMPPEELRTLL